MSTSCSLRRRARLVLGSTLAAVIAVSALGAAPAGAQAGPPDEAGVVDAADADSRFDSAFAGLVRALHRAERARVAELTALDLEAKAATECVDAGPADADVPTLVGEIFRCRLLEAGFVEPDVGRWTAEALVVSQCESLWDTHAVVFGGRYRDAPHPNGNRYSAAGVFQFIRVTADRWIEGGYANVHDARSNIDAAARLFIHNRLAGFAGWDDWACAAANDGFKVGSVLPGWPGGPPELPAWAWDH
jgi:hypothetical protein